MPTANEDERKRPWLLEHALPLLGACGLAITLLTSTVFTTMWLSGSAYKADATATALISVNARLDRIFEKLDLIPVLQDHVASLDEKLRDTQGGYNSLETRLRAIENNNAANHADIEAVKPYARRSQ